jgi:hypothetical protein
MDDNVGAAVEVVVKTEENLSSKVVAESSEPGWPSPAVCRAAPSACLGPSGSSGTGGMGQARFDWVRARRRLDSAIDNLSPAHDYKPWYGLEVRPRIRPCPD